MLHYQISGRKDMKDNWQVGYCQQTREQYILAFAKSL